MLNEVTKAMTSKMLRSTIEKHIKEPKMRTIEDEQVRIFTEELWISKEFD